MATVTSVGDSGNVLIDSLAWGTRWDSAGTKTVIRIGYSTAGALQPTWQEQRAIDALLASYEAVINVDFQFVGNVATQPADIVFSFKDNANSLYYGTGEPPGESLIQSDGSYRSTITIMRSNYKDGENAALRPGSFDYFTFQHEFGHAMGLAHPHDNGGTSIDQSMLFPGLSTYSRALGDYGLNQTVFTAMSYNFGWKNAPLSHTPAYKSHAAGPMAIDIAALQYIYGANTEAARGNTTYKLAEQVAQRAFNAIWDTGGNDTISARGMASSVIDLRAATLKVAEGGGGYVSYVVDQPGGFTIAKGVTIENALGGNGNDVLLGNTSSNVLTGGNGRDVLYGRNGNDRFDFNHWTDSNGAAVDVIKDFSNGDRLDLSSMDANWTWSFSQDFIFKGAASRFSGAGQVRFVYSGNDTLVYLNFDADQTAESVIRLSGRHALDGQDFLL